MFEKLRRWIRLNLFYLGRPPWDTGVSPPELMAFLESAEPSRALDVGCGTGTNLVTMAKHGWEVVGVDFAFLSVLRSRAKLRKAGINARVIRGDVSESLEFSPPFDFILDIGCYHSLTPKDREGYRQNIKQGLKIGGTYLIYAHRRPGLEERHGITAQDIYRFQSFMRLQWRSEGPEKRPDGGGGRPSTWTKFVREEGL